MSLHQSVVTDFTDVARIHPNLNLYLKPIAKIHISVTLPKLKIAGQTISNWEVQNKLRELCSPLQLKNFNVFKGTTEYIKFECEVGNKGTMKSYITSLDYKSIKLPGFPELLKVTCVEVKSSFPTRHDWDGFFGDSNKFDETQAGERPDTIYMSGVPCQFFSHTKTGIVNEDKVRQLFSVYGKVRNVDIPMLDPYRSETKGSSVSFKPFSYEAQLSFELYVQFEHYKSFSDCMNAFRAMKLLMMESNDKAVAVAIKVDFDRSKHLSDSSIRNRRLEREKIEKLQRQREQQKRKEQLIIEEKNKQQLRRKEEERREKEVRRKKREEKRRQVKEERKMMEEAAKQAYKIQREERKLLLATRHLQAVRLATFLTNRLKKDMEAELEERKVREMKVIEDRRRKEVEEEKMQQRVYKEQEMKSRLLKRKLDMDYHNKQLLKRKQKKKSRK